MPGNEMQPKSGGVRTALFGVCEAVCVCRGGRLGQKVWSLGPVSDHWPWTTWIVSGPVMSPSDALISVNFTGLHHVLTGRHCLRHPS